MGEVTTRNFGLIIAYLIPGYLALHGVAKLSPAVQLWMAGQPEPTVGGFLYLTLGSIAAGMTVSAVRWALVDTIHHRTGLPRPSWDDSKLTERLAGLEYLVEAHYRYYQFYANSLVAIIFSYGAWRGSEIGRATPVGIVDGGVVLIVSVFAMGSRDALRKYYHRATLLLGKRK